MARRKNRTVLGKLPVPQVRHAYPPGWRPDTWLVPFIDGSACIHHGHTAPDDHSLCGPSIFCCRQSAARYVALHPDGGEAQAIWKPMVALHLLGWIENGVQVFYFIFCDLKRPDGLLAIGLPRETIPAILRRRISLDGYAASADRLL